MRRHEDVLGKAPVPRGAHVTCVGGGGEGPQPLDVNAAQNALLTDTSSGTGHSATKPVTHAHGACSCPQAQTHTWSRTRMPLGCVRTPASHPQP